MRNEIGSEFWTHCTPMDGSGLYDYIPYKTNAVYTLSGRTALDLIIDDMLYTRPIKSVYLPSYCCHTMIEPFLAHGIETKFYTVAFVEDGIRIELDEDNNCDVVFLIEYFGFMRLNCAEIAASQSQKGKTIIYDATHSLFCKEVNYSCYDYVFGSFRKWFDVNAGFCTKKYEWNASWHFEINKSYVELRNKSFDLKKEYILGETESKEQFLDQFAEAEDSLGKDYHSYCPDNLSIVKTQMLNVKELINIRKKNAQELINQLIGFGNKSCRLLFDKVDDSDVPLFVPVVIQNQIRNPLRTYLISNELYLPVHWPLSELHLIGNAAVELYNTELSLVCDQRYGQWEMNRIVNLIESFFARC